MDVVAVLAAEHPAVGGGPVQVKVLAKHGHQLRRDRDPACGPAGHGGRAAFGPAFEAPVLVHGAKVADGGVGEVRSNPDVIAAYLGVPVAKVAVDA